MGERRLKRSHFRFLVRLPLLLGGAPFQPSGIGPDYYPCHTPYSLWTQEAGLYALCYSVGGILGASPTVEEELSFQHRVITPKTPQSQMNRGRTMSNMRKCAS